MPQMNKGGKFIFDRQYMTALILFIENILLPIIQNY